MGLCPACAARGAVDPCPHDPPRAPGGAPARRLGGRYRLLAPLGRGAMGTVHWARDEQTGDEVAVKILDAGPGASEASEARFQQEIKAAALLSHPNIVATLDAGRAEDGRPYYVMELVEGETLADLVTREAPLAPARALDLARQVAAALAEAHGRGVVHRDVKPANVMVARDAPPGRAVKILDFGVMKALAGHDLTVLQLTQAGFVVGTLPYMAPESIDDFDGRADLYALGCVLYELLVGEPPYPETDALRLIAAHRSAPVPSPRARNPAVGEELDALVRTLLAKRPEDRVATAQEVVARIDALGKVGGEAAIPAGAGGQAGPGPAQAQPDAQAAPTAELHPRHAPTALTEVPPAPAAPAARAGEAARAWAGRLGAVLADRVPAEARLWVALVAAGALVLILGAILGR